MRKLTTFRTGGTPIRYFRPVGYRELVSAVRFCERRAMDYQVLGGGSNLLVEDGELPFGVLHICSPAFNWIERTGEAKLRVGAGVRLGRLLSHSQKSALGGLEFLASIPGTVGGAVAGNAGAWGRSVCEMISRLWLLGETSQTLELPARELEFGYRMTELPARIITEVELKLVPSSPELIKRRTEEFLHEKARRHPMDQFSAGCVFKNPPDGVAGKMLEACGMKGKTVGGAEVSCQHANFIVNRGGATSSDVLKLIETMQEAVLKKFGVQLELELRHWPAGQKAA